MSEVREPFEWVEIDQDLCSRTYSVAPCTASLSIGNTECYNTRSTCQDPTNYDRSTLTLRFCKNQAFLPEDAYYIPSLESVSLSAGSINPVGANQNSSALGTRGGISVRFQDHPHTDRYVDPYIANRASRDAGYIATERGTFWSKWRARNPYYLGRVIRHKIGFIEGDQVVDVTTRTYFITSFDGPDASGNVSITGKDLLSQITNEKAKAPMASNGKLLASLSTGATSFTLDPVGIGNDEYPASGVVRIGKELMTFTRVGDAMTATRAQYNTVAATANAGDTVQLCLEYSSATPADILDDLLSNYAGIPSGYLNTSQWAQEQTDFMPRLYSALITQPTGVAELVGEMCQQMYFYPIWDERNAVLNIRAIRPAENDTVYDLADFGSFVADSVTLRDLPEQLVTQVWVYYGIINPTESATEPKNYAVREIIATDESLPEKQGTEKIKQIFCRWIPSTNGAAAIDLGQKMVARYGAAPRQVSFTLAQKDSQIWLGDFVTVSHRLSVDATGQQVPLNIQVLSAQEARQGVEFRYIGQEFVYEAPVDPNDRLIIIAANQTNINLRTLHDSIYAAPVGGENIRVIIRSGVVIGARGASDLEGYTASMRSIRGPLGAVTFNASVNPVMNRDIVSRVFRARDSAITVSGQSYLMSSDMWEVPCSVAFDTGTWPLGVTITVTQEAGAVVEGEGGYACRHGGRNSGTLSRGFSVASDGGHAMAIQYPVTWNNLGSIIAGGASGYAGVACWRREEGLYQGATHDVITSGGGAGYRSAAAPVVADWFDAATLYLSMERQASSGSLTAGGTGSRATSRTRSKVRITAGNGGGPAGIGTNPSQVLYEGGAGYTRIYPIARLYGRAGNAIIQGANLITWTNKGDVRGPEAN